MLICYSTGICFLLSSLLEGLFFECMKLPVLNFMKFCHSLCGQNCFFLNKDYWIKVFPIVLVELNLLRNVDANNPESSTTVKSSSLLSGFRGGSSYNHETETIFALPRMQLDFKSIHVQEPQEPSLQGIVKTICFPWSKAVSHKWGVKYKDAVLIRGFFF